MEHLNNQIELVTGKVQQIYTMEGQGVKIQKIEDIENGKGYILVANKDPLIRIRYNTKAIQVAPSHGLEGMTLKNEHMSRIRKVTEKWSIKQQKLMHEQTSFTESVKGEPMPKNEAPKQEANKRGLKTPKTPSQPIRQKSAVSEIESYSGDVETGTDEIYGEQEVQEFSKKSTIQPPRAPGISYKKSESASPKIDRGSKVATPKTELKSSKTDIRSSVASPSKGSKGESKSSSNIRSEVASPKSVVRSSVATPDPVSRSDVASPKPAVRSAVASPDPRSRLTSAGAQSSVASDEGKASQSESSEKGSRPQSEAKSIIRSNRGSKDGLKSQKGSNDKLSRKVSQDGLKPRGTEVLTSSNSDGTDQ